MCSYSLSLPIHSSQWGEALCIEGLTRTRALHTSQEFCFCQLFISKVFLQSSLTKQQSIIPRLTAKCSLPSLCRDVVVACSSAEREHSLLVQRSDPSPDTKVPAGSLEHCIDHNLGIISLFFLIQELGSLSLKLSEPETTLSHTFFKNIATYCLWLS